LGVIGGIVVDFRTSRKRSGSFWPIRSYVFAYYFGNVWFSGTRTSLTDSRHGNLNFRRVIRFWFLSEFYFQSHFYIRDSGGSTASPCALPEDHGRGRFYAAYLARTGHYGRRISSRAAHEADCVAGCCDTIPGDVVSMIFYLLDSESTRIATY